MFRVPLVDIKNSKPAQVSKDATTAENDHITKDVKLPEDQSAITTRPERVIKLDEDTHPDFYRVMFHAIDNAEGEIATETLQEKVGGEIEIRTQEIMSAAISNEIMPDVAASRLRSLQGATESRTEKEVQRELEEMFSNESDYPKKLIYAKVFEKYCNPWEQIIKGFESNWREIDRNFWIQYLKSLSDAELKNYLKRINEGGVYLNVGDAKYVGEAFLEVRGADFLLKPLFDLLRETPKGTDERKRVEIILLSIAKTALEKGQMVPYDYVEALYRTEISEIRNLVAEILVDYFGDKAVVLFTDLMDDNDAEIKKRDFRFHAVQHYGITAQRGLIIKDEGIKKLASLIETCDDLPVLGVALATLSTDYFGEEGKKRAASLVKEEIIEVEKLDKDIPIRLVVLTHIAAYSEEALATLKEVLSFKYEEGTLASIYKKANKVRIFKIVSNTEKTHISYSLDEDVKVTMQKLITEIGFANLIEMATSENEILSKNVRDLVEYLIQNSRNNEFSDWLKRFVYRWMRWNDENDDVVGLIYKLAGREQTKAEK